MEKYDELVLEVRAGITMIKSVYGGMSPETKLIIDIVITRLKDTIEAHRDS